MLTWQTLFDQLGHKDSLITLTKCMGQLTIKLQSLQPRRLAQECLQMKEVMASFYRKKIGITLAIVIREANLGLRNLIPEWGEGD